jgi:hypothetical protein
MRTRIGAWPASALAAAERAFTLLACQPAPLALDGRAVGHGLPDRHIPVDELRHLLVHDRSVSYEAKDAAWRQLVDHARTWGPAWVVAAVGIALPALTTMAGRLCAGHLDRAEDIESELLAGFLHALRTADVSGPAPYARLCWAGWRAGRTARGGEATSELPELADPHAHSPARPYGHPDLILGRAVAAGVITAEQADLISATRLGDTLIDDIATQHGLDPSVLRMRRRRAELAVARRLRRGDLSTETLVVQRRQIKTAQAARTSKVGSCQSQLPHDGSPTS